MNQKDPAQVATAIIDEIVYMTLGTADENGEPWLSPVYFAAAGYKEFYWISSPEAKHSRNIAGRPHVSIVVFDSRMPVGMGQAVYISAIAEEVSGADLDRGLAIYNGRFENPADHGVYLVAQEGVQASAPYRLYRAIAHKYWVLDRDSHPDRRIAVTISNIEES